MSKRVQCRCIRAGVRCLVLTTKANQVCKMCSEKFVSPTCAKSGRTLARRMQ